ncbi:MAG: FapA family protein [bacterium]|nr:FapA family protein [bacterium]
MAKKEIIIQGDTVDQAVERGCRKLGVEKSQVDHEVLVKGRQGLFGAKGRPFEVRVFISAEKKQDLDALLSEMTGEGSLNDEGDASLGVDSYCELEINEDGVFFTVYQAVGAGKNLTVERASSYIESRNIANVNWDEVERACNMAHGVPIKIAEYDSELYKEAQVAVDISSDSMTAFMTLVASQGGQMPGFDRAMQALQDAGVVVGIDEEAVKSSLESGMVNQKVEVAQGIPPVKGEDAFIKYRFQTHHEKHAPTEEEDGSVDFRRLDIVQNVTKGEPLAEKIPATEGKEGRTITGSVIPSVPGKDMVLQGGQNTKVSEDGLLMTSTIDGHVIFLGRIPRVVPIFDVKGDVDYSVGNIDFIGDVHITGNILDDFKVKAKGSITVGGNVQSAVLEAGGSIAVKGGIIGKDKGHVKASEDIMAKFVENANLDARRNVIIDKAIMHSDVKAGEEVRVTGKKAVIIGGKVMAGKLIESKTMGSYVDIKTEVQVGVDPRLIEEYYQTDEELTKYEKSLTELEQSINLMVKKKQIGKLAPEKMQLLQKWLTMRKQLMELIENLNKRREDLEEQASVSKEGLIKVSKILYPGVIVHIRTATKRMTEEIRFATLVYDRGEIRVGPYH